MGTHDPLDKAFDLLRARARVRASGNPDLEERMMKEFADLNRPMRSHFVKPAAVVVLCLVVAGAAVAATGGIQRILNWTGTVETLDGVRYEVEDGKILDSDGNVRGTVAIEIATD